MAEIGVHTQRGVRTQRTRSTRITRQHSDARRVVRFGVNMPCRSGEDYEASDQWRAECDKLTMMLCATLTSIEEGMETGGLMGKLEDTVPGLGQWWKDHKKADEARARHEAQESARQQIKAAAIAKLTPEERRVLGVEG